MMDDELKHLFALAFECVETPNPDALKIAIERIEQHVERLQRERDECLGSQK